MRRYTAQPNGSHSIWAGWRVLRHDEGEVADAIISQACDEDEAKIIAEALNKALGKKKP